MIRISNLIKSEYFVKSLLIISICFFILGISFPIFRSTKFFFWGNDISLLKSIRLLFEDKSYFLAAIILLFTFLFPITKYILLSALTFKTPLGKRKSVLKYLGIIGKWSMLDVFVIAMLILSIKVKSGFFTIEMRSGTIFFALSVITSILCSSFIGQKMKELK